MQITLLYVNDGAAVSEVDGNSAVWFCPKIAVDRDTYSADIDVCTDCYITGSNVNAV